MKKVHLALIEDQRKGSIDHPSAVKDLLREKPSSPTLAYILRELQRELGLGGVGSDLPAESDIIPVIDQIAERAGLSLSRFECDQILENLRQNAKPFGILQPLIDNPEISDVIVTNFGKVSVQQGRKNFLTSISFVNQEAYEAYVEKLLQRSGAVYSTKKPVADGMIGTEARVHAVHKVLCETGPYLTIRINRFNTVSIEQLVERGLAPLPVLSYLKAMVQLGSTVFVAGEVGTGKTTLVRALASTIPVSDAILVIEDTPEIQLEHPHVRYIRTRESNSDGAGRVSPSEVIRAGMRMAMNRIIFGEIRDAEAAEAFVDVCSSGHPGLSTVHAKSVARAISRLELFLGRAQRGVGHDVLCSQVAAAVQVIVHVDICRRTGLRRVMDVVEVGPVADGVLRQRQIFSYQLKDDLPTWRCVTRISAQREELESSTPPIVLGNYPAQIELEMSALYREAATRGVRSGGSQ